MGGPPLFRGTHRGRPRLPKFIVERTNPLRLFGVNAFDLIGLRFCGEYIGVDARGDQQQEKGQDEQLLRALQLRYPAYSKPL